MRNSNVIELKTFKAYVLLPVSSRCPANDKCDNTSQNEHDGFKWDTDKADHYNSFKALVSKRSPVVTYPLLVEMSSWLISCRYTKTEIPRTVKRLANETLALWKLAPVIPASW